MNLSEPAVETLLFRARNELQTELERLGREPSVRPRRSLRSLLVLPLPASLLNYLDSLAFTLSRSPLASRAAGAVAAVVLGAGVATQAGPLVQDAAADRAPAAARASGVPVSLADERLHTELVRPAAQAANGRKTKPAKDSASTAQAGSGTSSHQGDAGSVSATATSTSASGSGSTSVGGVVELPPMAVPQLPLPDVEGTLEQLPPAPVPPLPLG